MQLPVQPESSAAWKMGKELMPLGMATFEAAVTKAELNEDDSVALSCFRRRAV